MIRFRRILPVLLLLFAIGECVDRVLLKDVTAITLTDHAKTSGRRSSPVPQLTCVGGTARGQVKEPSIVQCHNRGFDGSDVQWECRAELDSRVRFGKISVSCEGYNYPDDPFVLKGSCGLEYELDWKHSSEHGSSSTWNKTTVGETIISYLSIAFIVGVIIYMFCSGGGNGDGTGDPPRPGFRRFGGGGFDQGPGYPPGGGGGGYGGAPPPPPPPSYDDATKGTSSGTSRGAASDGPGFWTGAGLGALGGYFMGRQQNQGYHNTGARYRGGFSEYDRSTGFGSSSYQPSSSGSGAGTSTSSGYGGTTRR